MKTNVKSKAKKVLAMLAVFWIVAESLYGQTQLYEQYKHRTDITVACIMQYPITETLKTDVTMFIPKTKEALWAMVQEFNLGLNKDKVYERLGAEKKYSLYMYSVRKDDIKKRYGPVKSADDYKNMMTLAYNYNKGVILVFHDIDTKERSDEVIRFLLRMLKNKGKLPGEKDKEELTTK